MQDDKLCYCVKWDPAGYSELIEKLKTEYLQERQGMLISLSVKALQRNLEIQVIIGQTQRPKIKNKSFTC